MRTEGAPDVQAAGAVVTRRGRQVLLVHRPRYDDWSFPKGKLDPGEHPTAAAVREVEEETGVHVRLGPPLPPQRYLLTDGRWKTVHYWVARAVGDDDVASYAPNDEVDAVAWLPWEEARERLTHDHDRETLDAAAPVRKKTRALVVLRHGQAAPREGWDRDDRLRPLSPAGGYEAQRLVPVLAAFDVTGVVSSSSDRCTQTVAPYAATTGFALEEHDALSEEGATVASVTALVDELLTRDEGVVVCSHRPVLPSLLDAAGGPDVELEPAGLVVVHHRRGRVVATERHAVD